MMDKGMLNSNLSSSHVTNPIPDWWLPPSEMRSRRMRSRRMRSPVRILRVGRFDIHFRSKLSYIFLSYIFLLSLICFLMVLAIGEDAIYAIGMGEYLFSPIHEIFIRGLYVFLAILISFKVAFFIDEIML